MSIDYFDVHIFFRIEHNLAAEIFAGKQRQRVSEAGRVTKSCGCPERQPGRD
jgi:hypothetical protein